MFKDCSNLKEIKCDNEIIINEYNGENPRYFQPFLFSNNMSRGNLFNYIKHLYDILLP